MVAVFGSFSDLEPGKKYEITILINGVKEISRCTCTANKKGTIPTVALW
jgi:hypothetical protein